MPELMLLMISLGTILSMPLISGFFARRMGRKFWVWFFIGCLLPFISVFIIFCLPDKTKNPVVGN